MAESDFLLDTVSWRVLLSRWFFFHTLWRRQNRLKNRRDLALRMKFGIWVDDKFLKTDSTGGPVLRIFFLLPRIVVVCPGEKFRGPSVESLFPIKKDSLELGMCPFSAAWCQRFGPSEIGRRGPFETHFPPSLILPNPDSQSTRRFWWNLMVGHDR